MNAKHLVATLSLMLAAGAAFAALRHGPVEPPRAAPMVDCGDVPAVAIPRVVVTAHRDGVQAADAPVARVVVTARRSASGAVVAATR